MIVSRLQSSQVGIIGEAAVVSQGAGHMSRQRLVDRGSSSSSKPLLT